jgi:hypothetical protein
VRTHGNGLVDAGMILGVAAEFANLPGSDKLLINIRSVPGDSGAPVFDPAGRVVGMVQASNPGFENPYTVLIPAF